MALYLTDQNGKPIQIAGFGISNIKIYNGLDSFDTTIALSAYQGNILNTKITELNTNILTLADSLASYYNKNETDLLLKDKASASDIPTKTSELQNDGDGTSSFATEQYVDNNGGKIDSISVNGIKQTIDQTKNVNIEITEYDDTEINRLIDNKVDKEEGKGLSSNDYTTEEKTKLAELNNYEESITNLENNKVDKSEIVSLPVGSIFASAIPQNDARVHLLDGSTISQTGVYETFANLIKALVSAGNNIAYEDDEKSTAEQKFNADVSATGNCGKFVIDDKNGTIRLPKITTFIQGLSNIADIGKSLEAGLPSITHTHPQYITANSGAYMGRQDYSSDRSNSDIYPHVDTGINSAVSPIYGKSDTVQPNATRYPYYIVLASGYKSTEVVDFDNIMNDVNRISSEVEKKLNKNDVASTIAAATLNNPINGNALIERLDILTHHLIVCNGPNCHFSISIFDLYPTLELSNIDEVLHLLISRYGNNSYFQASGFYHYANVTYTCTNIVCIYATHGAMQFEGKHNDNLTPHYCMVDLGTLRNTVTSVGVISHPIHKW